ncbi:MAG: sigma-54-dependent Fis family transcriptional regulator [Candidatus Riflebacteria bacterium]|nr:sigma-54-dependent Fis family transcriptional regulator [Candidatus Riflebacteria bacterium]
MNTEETPVAPVRVLVVEDDENYLLELKDEVVASCTDLAEFHYAANLKEAIRKIAELEPDLLLLDIIFPVDTADARADKLDYEAGVKVIQHVSERNIPSQILVLSSQSKGFAVNLLVEYKAVADYIFKDSSWTEIRVKVRKQLEALARLTEAGPGLLKGYRIVGESLAIGRVRDMINRVARKDETTVLVTGESGTGKELVAQNIHALSHRRDRPFVVVNCAAIPENLLESELFGYVPGAFTGAMKETKGKFEQAHSGTIFLDEIAEVPPSIQVKLLRALQDKLIQRLGDSRNVQVDARIIAATNRNLEEEIKTGRFRQDLFYRINVFPIHVPSLAGRREDIPELVQYYLNKFNRKLEETKGISAEALRLLEQHTWPGNVRELRNIVERLIIVTDGAVIGPADVMSLLSPSGEEYTVSFPFAEADYKKVKREILNVFNRRFLDYHLRANDYNIFKTAQAIGYNRQDLSVLIKELGIDLKKGLR